MTLNNDLNKKFMKTLSKYYILLIILATTGSFAQAQPPANSTTKFTIHFQNVVGKEILKLKDTYYTNAGGEKFNVTTFNYFISNIKLQRKNGTEHSIPQDSTYYLVKESDARSKDIILRVPADDYTTITFIVGVDSLMSTSDLTDRTGALDISGGMLDGMYWTWNSGYLFVKFEGESEQAKIDQTGRHKFRYHIGGYGGYKKASLNNIKTVKLALPEAKATKQNAQVSVTIQADALKIFDGKTPIRIADNATVMFGEQSKVVADNYSMMFSVVEEGN
jgi:hypothetical protein